MLKNYFKVAFRTLVRSKGYTLINVLGLAVGISGATMLMMYVNDELSFDMFHEDAENIFRIVAEDQDEGGSRFYGEGFPLMGKILMEDFSEVQEQLTVYQTRSQINFRLNERRITEESWWMADDNFFEFFDFELLSGDPSDVLKEPRSIVISESLAKKYFGELNPMGQLIKEFDWGEFTVTGIFKDVPQNSHLQFDLIIDSKFRSDDDWREYINDTGDLGAYTYIKLNPKTEFRAFQENISSLFTKYGRSNREPYTWMFQPLSEVHLYSSKIERGTDENTKGERSYIYVFGSIALFLLIVAAVNYTNLATSKALFRTKEVAVRKVIGAQKAQLAIQFLLESTVITTISLFVSVGLIDLVMPYFNQVAGKSFVFDSNTLMVYVPLLLVVTLFVGILSGIYPAFFISRFRPVMVLKGGAISRTGKISFRTILVVIQFGLSITLLVATLVVSRQMAFIENNDQGFVSEGVIVVDINSGFTRNDFKTMKRRFNEIPGVSSVAAASRIPGEWKSIPEVSIINRDADGKLDSIGSYYMSFDKDVKAAFGLRMTRGDYFSGNDLSDSTKVLLNQAAVEAMGLQDPIGQSIRINRRSQRFLNAKVIGIFEDFNYQSFHSKIAPLVVGSWNSGLHSIDYFVLKIATNNVSQVVNAAEEIHNEFDPATTIDYNFLDDRLKMKYENETRASTIFKIGSGLSIMVACLGLLGLASFTVQKRAKELGIRKVLGANDWNIFYILSSSFVKQIMIAFLISTPIAYFMMRGWLSQFEYQVGLGVGVFLVAGFASVLVALLTVSYRSIKAAHSNPVDSLRSE